MTDELRDRLARVLEAHGYGEQNHRVVFLVLAEITAAGYAVVPRALEEAADNLLAATWYIGERDGYDLHEIHDTGEVAALEKASVAAANQLTISPQ